ncbi:MAG: hypothetical protein Q9182_006609 [Xanthomendoza sp. 2 TL-2023]
MSTINPPKALLFDVFGTLVDWRTTVTHTLSTQAALALNSPSASVPTSVRLFASTISWPDFAQQWHDTYKTFTSSQSTTSLSRSKHPFKTTDQHHHDSLLHLLHTHSLTGLWSADQLLAIAQIWHFIDPWPDTSAALHDLSKSFILCTLSNTNVSSLRDLAHHADLPFSRLLSSEHFGAYKPSPLVYNGAAEHLGLRNEQCALVSAQLGDLRAARACGFQTVYIERMDEEDWSVEEVREARREGWVDMWIEMEDVRGSAAGGLAEVRGRFKTGASGYVGGRGWGDSIKG